MIILEDAFMKKYAQVDKELCVACGECARHCPKGAISIYHGMYAQVDADRCVACGICARNCPAGVIEVAVHE